MNSFFHFIWIGPSFPLVVKQNLVRWHRHLAKSPANQFKIILWLNHDSLREMFNLIDTQELNKIKIITSAISKKSWGAYFPADSEMNFMKISIDNKIFYAGLIEDLLEENKIYQRTIKKNDIFMFEEDFKKFVPNLINQKISIEDYQEHYKILYENKLYPFLSDFFRILALDEMTGVYMDIDIPPNEQEFFPSDINQLREKLHFLSENDFYINPSFSGYYENQVIIYCPVQKKIHALCPILDIGLLLFKIHHKEFLTALILYNKYRNHETSQLLNKSNYCEPEMTPIMSAFSERNATQYKNEISIFFNNSNKNINEKTQHSLDPKISFYLQLIFFMIRNYFFYHCIILNTELFKNVFSLLISLNEQSQFFEIKNGVKKPVLLYSWSSPGFARLSKMEWASKTLQRHWRQRKPRPIQSLVQIIHSE